MQDRPGPRTALVSSILSWLRQSVASRAHECVIVDDIILWCCSVFVAIYIVLGNYLNVVFNIIL